MKLNLTLPVAALAGMLAGAVHAQSVIGNGSFESGDFTGWNTSDALWTVDSASGVGAFSAPDGSYYALLLPTSGGTSTLDQTFATIVGNSYTVEFWANVPFNNVGLTVSAGGTTGVTLVPGTTYSGVTGAGWQDFTFTFTAPTTTTDLAFAGIADGFLGVDNVTVTPVPEPTTLALAGLGALGLAAFRQRRAR